ncbi:MAG: hypothetical protein WDO12_06675 [Pseudomonadota bacterium]
MQDPQGAAGAHQSRARHRIQASFQVKQDRSVESHPDDLSLLFAFDGMHDLVQFDYDSEIGVLLNPHPSISDAAASARSVARST